MDEGGKYLEFCWTSLPQAFYFILIQSSGSRRNMRFIFLTKILMPAWSWSWLWPSAAAGAAVGSRRQGGHCNYCPGRRCLVPPHANTRDQDLPPPTLSQIRVLVKLRHNPSVAATWLEIFIALWCSRERKANGHGLMDPWTDLSFFVAFQHISFVEQRKRLRLCDCDVILLHFPLQAWVGPSKRQFVR